MKKNILLAVLSTMLIFFIGCDKDEITNAVLTYDISMPVDINYTRYIQPIDSAEITDAFNLSYSEFMENLGVNDTSVVHYYALQPDATINDTKPTASGFGHWFNADGGTTNWGENAVLFSEFNDCFEFEIGQYAGATKVGDTYTIKQGFVYKNALASITFNITITAE